MGDLLLRLGEEVVNRVKCAIFVFLFWTVWLFGIVILLFLDVYKYSPRLFSTIVTYFSSFKSPTLDFNLTEKNYTQKSGDTSATATLHSRSAIHSNMADFG